MKIKKVISIYDKLNIRSATEKIAKEYFDTAFILLDKVNADNERKKELAQLASSLIGRDK